MDFFCTVLSEPATLGSSHERSWTLQDTTDHLKHFVHPLSIYSLMAIHDHLHGQQLWDSLNMFHCLLGHLDRDIWASMIPLQQCLQKLSGLLKKMYILHVQSANIGASRLTLDVQNLSCLICGVSRCGFGSRCFRNTNARGKRQKLQNVKMSWHPRRTVKR